MKNALSFKSDCVQLLCQICGNIRKGFLQNNCFDGKSHTFAYINDEQLFVKSIDSKQITTWSDFEFVLSMVVENRILKVFVAHQVQLSLQSAAEGLFDDLLSDECENGKLVKSKKPKRKNKKKVKA